MDQYEFDPLRMDCPHCGKEIREPEYLQAGDCCPHCGKVIHLSDIVPKLEDPGDKALKLLKKLYDEVDKFTVYENAGVIPVMDEVEKFLREKGIIDGNVG